MFSFLSTDLDYLSKCSDTNKIALIGENKNKFDKNLTLKKKSLNSIDGIMISINKLIEIEKNKQYQSENIIL